MFRLKIRLGNAAMLDPQDVAEALVEVAEKLRNEGGGDGRGNVRDVNGNTVGEWSYKPGNRGRRAPGERPPRYGTR
jgi:hypothetical protein